MYTVSVRELCAFTAKQGDLDLRFTPAPTAQEGIAGHTLVYERRGESYRKEVSLTGDHGALRVRGRADGVDPIRRRVEEIKTYRGSLERQRPTHRHLHWAQAKIYGWLVCEAEGWESLDVALVYLELGRSEETVLVEHCSAAELRAHFDAHCERFLVWAMAQLAHRQALDTALQALRFPFGDFRTGQRTLAEAVYRAAAGGRCLLAQAPTGIGKTLATLFPLLKATPGQRLDKVFFLAAKTSGRQTALDALARLQGGDASDPAAAPLRVLEMVARDKSCEHPDKACHGDACPLARGFYDRLPAARSAALGTAPEHGATWTREAVREAALAHGLCPYYLSQELARWADVIVGDYHYYFDHGALLHGLTQENQWRVAVLVDEAHNLVERGRKMFSATLSPELLQQARHSPSASASALVRKALDKVSRQWRALDKAQTDDYTAYDRVPEALLTAVQHCSGVIAEHLAQQPDTADPELLAFHFEALHLIRAAESFGPHSMVDLQKPTGPFAKPGRSTLCIRNIVPASFLRPRLQAAHTSTLFSATLQPHAFHADLLGLPENHVRIDVGSPFDASQLQVQISGHISTRYQHRQASLQPIADLIAEQFRRAPGNYLAFLSSYDYLQQVADLLAQRHPEVPQWRQSRRMSEPAQRQFLDSFTDDSRGVGFAVLGGAFAEGVDLPGRRLIGAFLSTLGLPQVNPVNEQIRQRMDQLFGDGYDYTYLYPGLQKVVQAAGRVIRTTHDRGVIHLIDDRFARAEVQRLLPTWWSPSLSVTRPKTRHDVRDVRGLRDVSDQSDLNGVSA
ncbi:ATP-dependent DNA helicase [Roseateles amylovorans]|uniref:ATP-dependent DNA helicase n=1 Tax=Roseateles amylovorans TaxID=2978473 RepID=A0ABY6B5A8_9BURK|nr:ATP-dependent DNA helicase [Roseateles amylovorans]UXH79931.1 ATP-dependent DNA helicase [Roseateles amylovorans]